MHKGLAFGVLPSAFGLFTTVFNKGYSQKEGQDVEWPEMKLLLKSHLRKDSLASPVISFALGSGALCD